MKRTEHLAATLPTLTHIAASGDSTAAALHELLEIGSEAAAIEARELAWERLHSGRWDAVDPVFREAYGAAQLLIAEHELKRQDCERALKSIDMALLMGGPGCHAAGHPLARQAASTTLAAPHHQELNNKHISQASQQEPRATPRAKRLRHDSPLSSGGSSFREIERVQCPSLNIFLEKHMNAQRPCIITGGMDHWPALREWKDLGQIRAICGKRTVPVEIGKTYLSDKWTQELMTINEFLDRYVATELKPGCPIGYLAQHEIFSQVPELRAAIMTPDFCALLRPDEEHEATGEPVLNAWLGPGGTVSPLHFDPCHNLLAQVVGSKKVCLFNHADTPLLYSCGGILENTSAVDPENPDIEEFPLFPQATGFQATLNEGEMLYIPPLFWHFVRSLETSFSVSFWWGRHWEMSDPPSPLLGAAQQGATQATSLADQGRTRTALKLPPPVS